MDFVQLGNTCYFNSVIQLLYHIDSFRDRVNAWKIAVFAASSARGVNPASAAPLSISMAELFDKMDPPDDASGGAWKVRVPVVTPKPFLRVVQRMFPDFADQSHQHDAHELLTAILNGLEDEMHSVEKEYGIIDKQRCLVHGLFEGTNLFEMQCCGCDSVTTREEPFLNVDIDIPMAEKPSKTFLRDLLSNRQRREVMTGEERYFCDSCRCSQEATRRVLIGKVPQVLLIQLKRFHCDYTKGQLSKTSNQVIFPLQLEFKQNGTDLLFDLCGCVVHIGRGLNSGHYVCVCKTKEQWFVFNDDYIVPVDEGWLRKIYGGRVVVEDDGKEKVFNSHAYLLAYVRRDAVVHSEGTVPTEQSKPSTSNPPPEKDLNLSLDAKEEKKEDDHRLKSDGKVHTFSIE